MGNGRLMAETTHSLKLPPTTNYDSCDQLAHDLARLRGKPIEIHAHDVSQISALPAQLLAVARPTWAGDAVDFRLVDPSVGFRRCLGRLGLTEAVMGGN